MGLKQRDVCPPPGVRVQLPFTWLACACALQGSAHAHACYMHLLLIGALQGSALISKHQSLVQQYQCHVSAFRIPGRMCPRMPQGSPSAADIMVVGSSDTASNVAFLQCLAWDPVHEWFNFYARSRQGDRQTGAAAPGLWVYAGNSTHAFVQGSRGRGPFDGHVSGSLVMKELECAAPATCLFGRDGCSNKPCSGQASANADAAFSLCDQCSC